MKDSTISNIRVTECTEDRSCDAFHSCVEDRADVIIEIRLYDTETIVALCAVHACELCAALMEAGLSNDAACLIAAAPDLLRACKLSLGPEGGTEAVRLITQAAITKAEGGAE